MHTYVYVLIYICIHETKGVVGVVHMYTVTCIHIHSSKVYSFYRYMYLNVHVHVHAIVARP